MKQKETKKPLSGVVPLTRTIWLNWYWSGNQIDGHGVVEWDVTIRRSMCVVMCGQRACVRKNSESVALRTAWPKIDLLVQGMQEASNRAWDIEKGVKR